MTDSSNSIAPPLPGDATIASLLARPRVKRWLLLILILWLALFLRVWQLDTLPPGLHYDEAFNGTMARDVLRGINRPIFFTPNFGEEPLHIYTEALFFALLGESPWTIRLVSAIFGVISVAAIYACARAFFPRSDVLALVASFIAATLYWAINFSRIGIEPNGLPMLLTLSAAALGHAYRKMTWLWTIGAGFLIGATVYTYLASRLWPFAVLLWFLYLLVLHRPSIRANFSKWMVMGIVALVTLAPLIFFFVANPVALTGRSGTVFTPETFVTNLGRTAAMFLGAGDTDPRDNLPGRPALDILLFGFFSLGLVLSLLRFRKPFYALLIVWLVVMCLPSVLTEFAPNFRRAIGALPATILFCAVGVDWLWSQVSSRDVQPRAGPSQFTFGRVAKMAILGVLVVSAFWSVRAYFVEWAGGSGLYYSFDSGLLKVAQALAARPPGEDLYLTPDYDEHYTVIWALDGRPVSSFDGRRAIVLANAGRAATYGIITREDSETLARLGGASFEVQNLASIADFEGQSYAQIERLVADDWQVGTDKEWVRVEEFAHVGVMNSSDSSFKRDGIVNLELGWRVDRSTDLDYTVFVQLVGPTNPATGCPIWSQQDSQPGHFTYPTGDWREGQLILEKYRLEIPPHASPGEYQVLAGMYLLETGARVPLYGGDGLRLRDDTLVVHSFSLD